MAFFPTSVKIKVYSILAPQFRSQNTQHEIKANKTCSWFSLFIP